MNPCPVCQNNSAQHTKAHGYIYFKCLTCGCLFTMPIRKQDIHTDNDAKDDRNNINRLAEIRFRLIQKRPVQTVLDYGCGDGEFVTYLNTQGLANAIGIDQHNENDITKYRNKFDAITMIEVIEHILEPHSRVRNIHAALKPKGIFYIQTSLAEYCHESYVDPRIGHCLIHSEKSLKILAGSLFNLEKLNRNCFIMEKK